MAMTSSGESMDAIDIQFTHSFYIHAWAQASVSILWFYNWRESYSVSALVLGVPLSLLECIECTKLTLVWVETCL